MIYPLFLFGDIDIVLWYRYIMSIKIILGVILCVLLPFVIYQLKKMFILKMAGDKISTNNVITGIYENGVVYNSFISIKYFLWDKVPLYDYSIYGQDKFITYEFFPRNSKNEIKVKINKIDIEKINNFLYKMGIHHIDKQN
jgi:hypothetical protein